MSEPNSKTDPASDSDGISVPLIEETVSLAKREVTTGRVVVRTVVDVKDLVLNELLSDEQIDVERVPIDRVVDVAPQTRIEGDVTIVPVFQERIVVEKQLILVEEVRITRRRSTETVEIPVQIRTQKAVVERS